MFVLFVHL